MSEYKSRKNTRLQNIDYNEQHAIFITLCTVNRRCILSRISVGTGVLDGPIVELLPFGKIAEKYIKQLNCFYTNLSIDSYVIMPNHIHMLICFNNDNGPSRTPVPTLQNSTLSRFISTFKRFCNKECGENIWQYRSYDHIIRSKYDYDTHIKYIYDNPSKWLYDEMFMNE